MIGLRTPAGLSNMNMQYDIHVEGVDPAYQ